MSERKGNYNDRSERKKEERQEFRSYVTDIGVALLLIAVPFALMHWARGISRLSLPSGQTSVCDERTQRKQDERP